MVYMALCSLDGDAEPWFSLGSSSHETLAEFALGLRIPDDPAGRDAALRIVRRHITPLFMAGAIETTRRAVSTPNGIGSAVVYRLWLDGPSMAKLFPPPAARPAFALTPEREAPYRSLTAEGYGASACPDFGGLVQVS